MHWIYLVIAIAFEVTGTLSIKQYMLTSNYYWIGSIVICYTLTFSLLAISIQKIEIGTAYAIWAGVGTALIVILGWLFFKESLNLIKLIGLGLIILGTVLLKLQHT